MPNLAISLHAPTDAIRGELVPINRKYGVAEIIAGKMRNGIGFIHARQDEHVSAHRTDSLDL